VKGEGDYNKSNQKKMSDLQFPSTLFVNPFELPSGAYGTIQLLFLMFVYGYILSTSANMIGDGSELLLLIPSLAGIVGSIVLPVLGTVYHPPLLVTLFLSSSHPKLQRCGTRWCYRVVLWIGSRRSEPTRSRSWRVGWLDDYAAHHPLGTLHLHRTSQHRSGRR